MPQCDFERPCATASFSVAWVADLDFTFFGHVDGLTRWGVIYLLFEIITILGIVALEVGVYRGKIQ